MSTMKRIGLAAVALTACATGVFAATGFGEGGEESSGFSYLSGKGARVAAQDHDAMWAKGAGGGGGGGGGKPRVIVIARPALLPPGQTFREVGKCPKRSVAINGEFGPDGFGVNMQGFAAISPRTWGFQFENETGDEVSTLLAVTCLKNVPVDIRIRE